MSLPVNNLNIKNQWNTNFLKFLDIFKAKLFHTDVDNSRYFSAHFCLFD